MGSVPTGGGGGGGGGGNGQSDAASGGGQMDAIRWVDAAPGTGNGLPCLNAGTPTIDGHHNSGMDCMGCHTHDHGFTLAGTLYMNATGNTAFIGANITITDANDQQINIVTASGGNFWTKQAIAFPVTILASDCPSATKMNASVTTGHCNQAGCHPGGPMQMHLP